MSKRTCLSIILAAGEGTRMKSARPKILHELAGLPLIAHVIEAARASGETDLAVVVGPQANDVAARVLVQAPQAEIFEQSERLGTAHAVLAARGAIARGYDDILVMFGDTPLIDPASLQAARKCLADKSVAVAVMGFRTANPDGYGRLIENDGHLMAIREHKDASEAERAIEFCNGGLMAISGVAGLELLDAIGNENASGEYYLTDIVKIARDKGLEALSVEIDAESVLGINNRAELAEASAIWQRRKRREMMLSGVTLISPDTVFFSYDTQIGQDTVVEPNVFFAPGVRIGSGAMIRAFTHMTDAIVGDGAEVGPFARLRPGAELKEKSKVGNFCEIKKSVIHPGAKVNHLTYIGDAIVGPAANIGAGTITCNYDGYKKHLTEIGAGAFIGSNSSLVAPVKIGDGAYIGSGTVVTEDVGQDDLAISRTPQVNKKGRAAILRQRLSGK
jgi:bifunctional UDP-N-acetylglucosamine pyrophosphorylase/glucosamine-1-phosphate N-acetyltransferase